jgi:hypothetical protein
MTDKIQSKLMKLVCKQAALMREPYRNPPLTTHQINNVHKKGINVKKLNQTSKCNNKIKKMTQKTSSPIEKVRTIEQYNFLHVKCLLIDYNCFISFT